ncbi:unnamed protein product [Chondrus crispus]|uniref:Uncharacterized protein n=1 Tax=Chondrus crispus TaxID=2769 RepID=R7Q460_CHOCR|nr:unnamed protein product [Chondrus crispus]CDF33312.1 unnamed protein product [Chondrus crispus]|eukprot:XP_005713115.1 unnamed protein product [Chondrus crispus]
MLSLGMTAGRVIAPIRDFSMSFREPGGYEEPRQAVGSITLRSRVCVRIAEGESGQISIFTESTSRVTVRESVHINARQIARRTSTTPRDVRASTAMRSARDWLNHNVEEGGVHMILVRESPRRRTGSLTGCPRHGCSGLVRLPGVLISWKGWRAIGCYRCCALCSEDKSYLLLNKGWSAVSNALIPVFEEAIKSLRAGDQDSADRILTENGMRTARAAGLRLDTLWADSRVIVQHGVNVTETDLFTAGPGRFSVGSADLRHQAPRPPTTDCGPVPARELSTGDRGDRLGTWGVGAPPVSLSHTVGSGEVPVHLAVEQPTGDTSGASDRFLTRQNRVPTHKSSPISLQYF